MVLQLDIQYAIQCIAEEYNECKAAPKHTYARPRAQAVDRRMPIAATFAYIAVV